MAAQSYLKNNNAQQPKVSGQTRTIKLNTLYSSKYIDKVVDYKKETCNGAESYVKAIKYEDEIYYTAYLKCPNYTTDLNVLTSSINISTGFEGDNQNVKNVKATITITDSNGGDGRIAKGIISYQYSVYKEGKLVYSSDVYDTKKADTVTKTVSLSENVPGKIKITVTATNLHGLTKTKSFTHNYTDSTAPTCGAITGDSTTWEHGTRTVTVACNDDGGSVCPPVSKTFDSEMTTNKITVKDGAGNTKDCSVNVYIDKTKPSISYDIYKIDEWGNWVGGYNSGEWSTRGIRRLYPSDNNGGSGINHTEYSPDGSNLYYEGNVSQWDFHEGTNDTYFRTIDNAGNISSKIHFVLKVDKYAPQFKSELNYYDASWGGSNDRFGWYMYENASGVNSGSTIFEYCYSGYNNRGCGATCDSGSRYSHRPAHVNSDDWHYFQDATHLDAYNYQVGDYELSGGAVCSVSGHHIRTYFKVCDHAGNCDQRSEIFYK